MTLSLCRLWEAERTVRMPTETEAKLPSLLTLPAREMGQSYHPVGLPLTLLSIPGGLLRGWHQRGATGRAGPGGEGGGLSEHQELESQAGRRVATESHLPDHVEAGCRPLSPAQAVPSPWEARPFPRLAFISPRKGSGVSYVPALCSQSPSVLPGASDCSVPPSWTHLGSARGHLHALLVLDLGLTF